MQALIGGLIGALASATAWKAAEHIQQTNYGWMVCLVGLVTGFSVHKAGKAGSGGGFARGAIAVVLTLAAIVGGQKVYAMFMQASSPNAGTVVVETSLEAPDTSEAGGEEANESEMPAIALEGLGEEPTGLSQRDYSKSSMKKNLSEWDMIWMSLAALAAYVTGKGSDDVATEVVTEKPRDDAAGEPQETAENEGD